MIRPVLITGARIIDPVSGSDRIGNLFMRDGVIADAPETAPEDTLVVDGKGLVAAPGFIDLHAHLREPGFEDKESIETGTAAAAAGGFTTVCAMPNTSPAIDTAAVVDFIAHRAREAGPVRVLAFGAVSKGRKGVELTDMEELARAGVVGFTDDGSPVATGLLMEHALLYAGELGLPVMDHCEDHSITAGLGMHEGPVASRLGLAGYPSAGEESIIARDIALLGLTGGHFHVAHVSTAGGVEMVRMAKRRGLRVTAEVTPNHLTMTDGWVLGCGCSMRGITGPLSLAAYDTRAKVSPPLRSPIDRDALVEGLRDGTIDAVATDHAPHTFGDKATPFDEAAVGISTLETALGSLMGLVHSGAMELPTLVARLTTGPVSVLGERFANLASLAVGTPADVVLFDPEESWTVDVSRFASKGKNTPLAGETLQGRVRMTIAGGHIAFGMAGQ